MDIHMVNMREVQVNPFFYEQINSIIIIHATRVYCVQNT